MVRYETTLKFNAIECSGYVQYNRKQIAHSGDGGEWLTVVAPHVVNDRNGHSTIRDETRNEEQSNSSGKDTNFRGRHLPYTAVFSSKQKFSRFILLQHDKSCRCRIPEERWKPPENRPLSPSEVHVFYPERKSIPETP